MHKQRHLSLWFNLLILWSHKLFTNFFRKSCCLKLDNVYDSRREKISCQMLEFWEVFFVWWIVKLLWSVWIRRTGLYFILLSSNCEITSMRAKTTFWRKMAILNSFSNSILANRWMSLQENINVRTTFANIISIILHIIQPDLLCHAPQPEKN